MAGDSGSVQREGNEKHVKEAIILLGHGSRVPDAGKDMEQVSDALLDQAADIMGAQRLRLVYSTVSRSL